MDPSDRGPSPPRFEDDLAYLVLFSEALLDVVPEGVAVLDERLRVRAANGPFARAFGQPGTDLAGRPLLQAKVPERGGRPLGDLLRELAAGVGEALEARVDAPGEWGGRRWAVRATGWDAQDPRFRRVLLCARPEAGAEADAGWAPGAPGEDVRDHLFALTTRQEALLRTLPLGICFVDPALRVRAVSRRLEEIFGRRFRPDAPGDTHLFAVFPELRDSDFLERLQKCRDSADSIRGTLTVTRADGAPLDIEVEVQPVAGRTPDAAALLLLFHEVRGMFPFSTPKPETPTAVPAGPAAILAPENLARWMMPPNRRVLVVEKDGWSRMVLADSVREAGEGDVTLADSSVEALGRHDPSSFGIVLVGIDSDPGDAANLCRRLATDSPRVPVLLVTQRSPMEIGEPFADLPVLGLLSRPTSGEVASVLRGLFREAPARGPEPSPPLREDRREPEQRTYDVIVLGASEADVPVLRLLYRVQRVRVRMVFDPDPNAFGLSLAQNLGIPAISGQLRLELPAPPDAVVVARAELEQHLAALDLGAVTRVTRDEIELFLVDPDSFIAADRPRPTGPTPAPPSAPTRETPPQEQRPAGPPSLGAQAAVELPERTAGEPAAVAAPAPVLAPAPGEAPRATPETPRPEHQIARDVDSLLGALDLLLDFDRFADRVLEMALALTGGSAGSLMVLREDRRELRIAASRGLSDLVAQKARQRVGAGVAGRVAENGEPLLLTGAIRDESLGREWDRPDIRSSICVPVVSEERVIGVICMNSDAEQEPFGREELRKVTELGRQVGPALDRSLLLRRMRGRSFELAVRAEMETIATSGDDVLSRLQRIAGRLVDMLTLDTCSIYLSSAKRTDLVMRVSVGVSAQTTDAVSVPIGTGVVGWVAKNLRPIVLKSTFDDHEAGVVMAALPVRHHTDLVGVLLVESTSDVCFDEERLEILVSVAAVIGREVGGLRAHEDSERRLTMLSALSELGVAFGAVPEREGLARLLAFTACTVLESDVSSVRLIAPGCSPASREAAHFELLSAHGASLPGGGDPLSDLEERIARETVASRLPCRDTDLGREWVQPLLERANVSAALGLPLGSGDDVFGVLVVYRVADAQGTSAAFRDEEVEVATRLAGYAAASAQRFAADVPGSDRPSFPGDLR
jgi:GAF domain-containing protein/PAS domain-containing protein/CheY-like chemotaxis protein